MSSVPLPQPDADTAFFWDGCARGQLLVLRCGDCELYIHPPRPVCRRCGSANVAPSPVSGRGAVYSYTVTHQAVPGYEPPFAVVLVELEEQQGLRIVSQVSGVEPDDVRIGMPLQVHFVPLAEGVWVPMFKRRA